MRPQLPKHFAGLKEALRRLSNRELLFVVDEWEEHYWPEAASLAEDEARHRGGIAFLRGQLTLSARSGQHPEAGHQAHCQHCNQTFPSVVPNPTRCPLCGGDLPRPPVNAAGMLSSLTPSPGIRRYGMDLPTAEEAIRQGATAGFLVAAIILFLIAGAIMTDAQGSELGDYKSPWNLLVVALLVGLSIVMLRKSRTAAVALTGFYVLGKAAMFVGHRVTLVGLTFFFIVVYFLARAVRGTFAWHKIRRDQDPAYRPSQKWTYYLWIPGGVLALVLSALMVLSMIGPPHTVLSGEELSTKHLSQLRGEGILENNEEVVLFYTGGFLSILEYGNVITDRRVIAYQTLDDGLWLASAYVDEIAEVTIEERGGPATDTVILVVPVNGEAFYFYAPPEQGGDDRVLNEIRRRLADGKEGIP